MPPDIVSVISSGGGLGAVLLLLFWFRKYLAEHTANLQEMADKHNARIDKLIDDHRTEMANVVQQFRADILTISTDTSTALETLADEIKSLTIARNKE